MRIPLVTVSLATVALSASPTLPEDPLPPAPADLPPEFKIPLEQMKFDEPIRIEGRTLYLDTYDEVLWIEWTKIFEGGAWFVVPDERQFILYPRDGAMMQLFKALPQGSTLRVIVQRGQDGKVRALSLDEM